MMTVAKINTVLKILAEVAVLSRFRGSVNYGLLQSKIGFKSPNFYLMSQRLLFFFVWSEMAQGSLVLTVLALESVLNGP